MEVSNESIFNNLLAILGYFNIPSSLTYQR